METNSQPTGKASRPKTNEAMRSEILRKFRRHLCKMQTAKVTEEVGDQEMKPDVIVTRTNQTALFQPQNHHASEWLRQRCGLVADKIGGDIKIQAHPSQRKRIIEELKAAGFEVATL